jgi:hypothetical protein
MSTFTFLQNSDVTPLGASRQGPKSIRGPPNKDNKVAMYFRKCCILLT